MAYYTEPIWTETGSEYIRRKLRLIEEYLRVCDFQGLPPSRWVPMRLAEQIREWRSEHKFWGFV